MSDLECPYCEKGCEPSPDDFESNTPHEHECPHCEKRFIFTIEYYPSYMERKADCLNGSEHDWRDTIRGMEEYYEFCRECRDCEKREYKLREKA